MNKISVEFEIPEGYEFVRVGIPIKGEKYVTFDSQIVSDEPYYKNCIIVTQRVKLSSLRYGQLFKFDAKQGVYIKNISHIIDGKLCGCLYMSVNDGETYLLGSDVFVIPID